MKDNPLKVYGDVKIVVEKYVDESGKERNKYHKIGVMLATPHMSRIVIKLDSLPIDTRWLSVYKKEEETTQPPNQGVGF